MMTEMKAQAAYTNDCLSHHKEEVDLKCRKEYGEHLTPIREG